MPLHRNPHSSTKRAQAVASKDVRQVKAHLPATKRARCDTPPIKRCFRAAHGSPASRSCANHVPLTCGSCARPTCPCLAKFARLRPNSAKIRPALRRVRLQCLGHCSGPNSAVVSRSWFKFDHTKLVKLGPCGRMFTSFGQVWPKLPMVNSEPVEPNLCEAARISIQFHQNLPNLARSWPKMCPN